MKKALIKMPLRVPLLGVFLAFAMGIVSGVVFHEGAREVYAQCPGRSGSAPPYPDYRWVGSRRDVPSGFVIAGVRADIEHQLVQFVVPWNPSAGESRAKAWVQLVGIAGPWDAWYKAGWMRWAHNSLPGTVHFVETKKYGDSHTTTHWFNPNTVTTANFDIQAKLNQWPQYSHGAVVSYRNGQPWPWTSGYIVGFGNSPDHLPWRAHVSGETRHLGDQMPGTVGNRLDFTNAQVRLSHHATYQHFNGNGFNSNPAIYGLQGYSTTHLAIWDKDCP